VEFDYSKLRGQIKEKFSTQEEFSKVLGMDKATLSTKLNNKSEFSQYEMKVITEKLEIPKNEIQLYFFTENVEEAEQSEEE